ncbi:MULTISPECIES: rhomboid family intramembrane serine protease [Pseudomonas]|uniref:Peptidase S54 n=1 Tax=Pseudomonas flexibilis TaxID=706570 RepID=A0A0B3BYR6_9PSED|nr:MULTISPECIES: rhomboid family intramembrane serine protease [Pseudomonas]KHO65834.1 peptidase S54 [Pseudomonas flexibilis]SCX76063.1 GlpG protein [Pseudomonas flexibilis]
MSAVAVLRLPLETDLSGFLALLKRMGVPCRVSEESGQQVLWVPDTLAAQVRELYARFPQGDPDAPIEGEVVSATPVRRFGSLREAPFTALMLLLTLVVFAITWGGENLETIRWLSFADYGITEEYLYFADLGHTLDSGQWWRLFTPMLVHFGWLHLAMNSLWYWELGRRVEAHQGRFALLGFTLLFALVSNLAQYVFGGVGIFGGLSGVLYGLLGHCWLYQKLAPNPAYRLPPGVVGLMLVWLLVCLSGLVTALGLGAIANAAHVGGLLIGCATGVLGGWLARRR